MKYLFLILFVIIIIFLIINKYKLLLETYNYLQLNNFIINDDYSSLMKKYSSINLKDVFNKSLYYSIIETSSLFDEKYLIELIMNDIHKTKINTNKLDKLDNIYLIIKKINENIKIIILYDGIFNRNLILNKDDFTKEDLVYKLNFDNKIFSRYHQ